MTARFDPDALYVALDRKRRTNRLAWTDVAEQAGINKSGLTRLGQFKNPSADNLIRLLLWLGTTDLGPYIDRDGGS